VFRWTFNFAEIVRRGSGIAIGVSKHSKKKEVNDPEGNFFAYFSAISSKFTHRVSDMLKF